MNNKDDTLDSPSSILDLSRDAIVLMDVDGVIRYWNAGAARMFGYGSEQALGRDWNALLAPDFPGVLHAVRRRLDADGRWEGELECSVLDGGKITVLSRWELQRDGAGRALRMLMSATDILVWRRYLDTAMRSERQRFDSLFGHHPDGAFAFNAENRLVSVNAALCALTGYSPEELLSMPLARLVAPEHLEQVHAAFHEALRGKPQSVEFTCLRKDGERMEASVTLLPHISGDAVAGLHGIVKDVSHRKRDERRILYLANHDALTGLPNRNLLHDRMQHAIEQAHQLDSGVGVLYMDLNRFKIINDSLGHDKGDLLLCAIAERLRGAVRDVDTVARIGGDEFVVVLENIRDLAQVSQVAHNLLQVVCQPLELDGNTLTISTSIGASIYPHDGHDAFTLLKNADLAMYAAKESGSGGFCLYAPEMNARAVGRLMRENSLRRAIANGELRLHYQPRLDMTENRIAAVEALVRWEHPDKGLIFPAHFIELAEETGMIDALGEWVLLTACRQLQRWRDDGLPAIRMSVNVSALQLKSERIGETVARALRSSGLEAQFLELEITESSLMQNLDTSYARLQQFRAMGVSLSIDDFGTGYSSLSYLKRLPIDTLKIDKSFVRGLADDHDDATIVGATIAMAHSMGLRVVAEGVTSFDQLRFLEASRCDEIQGYLLCQPLPAQEVESFFRTCELRGIHFS